jgi:hypothetical protein
MLSCGSSPGARCKPGWRERPVPILFRHENAERLYERL